MKLVLIIVAGVIVADLVAHAAGTKVLFQGADTLFSIGINPTNTTGIKTVTPAVNNRKAV